MLTQEITFPLTIGEIQSKQSYIRQCANLFPLRGKFNRISLHAYLLSMLPENKDRKIYVSHHKEDMFSIGNREDFPGQDFYKNGKHIINDQFSQKEVICSSLELYLGDSGPKYILTHYPIDGESLYNSSPEFSPIGD